MTARQLDRIIILIEVAQHSKRPQTQRLKDALARAKSALIAVTGEVR